jgi:hypothetical protein
MPTKRRKKTTIRPLAARSVPRGERNPVSAGIGKDESTACYLPRKARDFQHFTGNVPALVNGSMDRGGRAFEPQ